MGKSLLVVESPTKAKTIKKYLGNDFDVIASVGHIKDLPKNELGIDVENDFTPKYVSIPGKSKVISAIRKAAKEADAVYLAPDPDREGEAIAWHIAEEIGYFKGKAPNTHRILIREVTPKGVREALADPKEINQGRYESQQARRILDRLVGYQISPILWDKVKRGLSAGRVQSVAVRLIVERERAIQAFKETEYWQIKATLAAELPPRFSANLFSNNGISVSIDNPKGFIKTKEEADAIVAVSESNPFVVKSVVKKERKRKPNPPFTTSKLQQEAAKKCRFTAKKTMSIAQKLFEGIEIGPEGAVGLITYMRTDSTRVAEDAIQSCRAYIKENYGNEYLPKTANQYSANKAAQDAHEAIRPTSVDRTPEKIKPYLTNEQFKLYQLIWQRFVASQIRDNVADVTTIDIENGPLLYRATGAIEKFKGYQAVYQEGKDEDESVEKMEPLPPLNKGDILKKIAITPSQHFTQPPKRFTEAGLVKELEDKGIGRPSTYASIISVIQDKEYVEKKNNHFEPTELGQLVTDLLVKAFPNILNVSFTADMETKLDKVETGNQNWLQLLNEFYPPFLNDLKEASESMRNVKRESEKTDLICEKCGQPLVIKWGKNGHFLACTGYPECKNTMEFERTADGHIHPIEKKVEQRGTCPECGKPMIIKSGRFGRFLACSGYPECKHTSPLSLGIPCPREGCNGELFEKRSKKGKIFYGCGNFPNCDYATWNVPTQERCPNCQSANLEEVKKREETKLLCPNCAFSKDVE